MPDSRNRVNLYDALMTPGALPENERKALELWSNTFYPYQKDWIFDPSRGAICNKSRQIGLSHASAATAVLWGAFLDETVVIVSATEDDAYEVLRKAVAHIGMLKEFGSKRVAVGKKSARYVEFKDHQNGRIIAASNEKGARGHSAHVILDEFALYDQREAGASKRVWDAAEPATMRGYKLRILSTPNGVDNMFYKLWEDPPKGWAKHQVDIYEAMNSGFVDKDGNLIDLEQLKANNPDPRVFAQKFECSFLEGDQQYLALRDIDGAFGHKRPPWFFEGPTFMGVDVGRFNDLTVVCILQRDIRPGPGFGKLWQVDERVCKRTEWEDQLNVFNEAVLDWAPSKICIDAQGMGSMPAETLRKKYGRGRVEELKTSLKDKDALATGLYKTLSEDMIRLRASDSMRKDLLSLRRIITANGNVRYDSPRTEDGHGDRAWALALAIRAATAVSGKRKERGGGDFTNA